MKTGALSLMSVMLTFTVATAVLVPSEDSMISLSVDLTSLSSLLAIVRAPATEMGQSNYKIIFRTLNLKLGKYLQRKNIFTFKNF